MGPVRLRLSEQVALIYFAYVALLIPFFRNRANLHYQPVVILIIVAMVVGSLARMQPGRYAHVISQIRDWLPLGLAFTAFREMEFFIPHGYDTGYELAWEHWDRVLLAQWGVTRAIESLGSFLPAYMELCYLAVYGVGAYCILALWLDGERDKVDRVLTIYLIGTLLSYAFFPYFPSRPPRLAFPGVDAPTIDTAFRTANWYLLSKATIHSAVFPSAHVSSAFAAAWAMFIVTPAHKIRAWAFLIYAVSVSLATVYGRYHYSADVLSGLAVSFVAGLVGLVLRHFWKETGGG